MLPFEFTIKGPPVSVQTRHRARLRAWRDAVAAAAVSAAPPGAPPFPGDVSLVTTYYYEGSSPDVDNIIKPIQDALIGVVYEDDGQIVETKCRKRSIDGSYKIRGVSSVLLDAFADGDGFLHIRVVEALGAEVLD